MAADDTLTSSVEVLRLPRGVYKFSVRSAAPALSSLGGQIALPGMHVGLGPGESADAIEFVASAGGTGVWLYKNDDVAMVRILAESAPLFLTSVRLDRGAPLDIEIERIGTSDIDTHGISFGPTAPDATDRQGLRIQVIAHIQNRGDLTFLDEAWAGLPGQRLWLEAFEIVPRERLRPEHIEYKALDAAGEETPWISGGDTCGTRGLGVPLLGFAVRMNPAAPVAGYDIQYFGRFLSGQVLGPARNGEPIFSSRRGDALESINIAIVPAPEEQRSAVVPPEMKPMKAGGRKIGPKFGVFREEALR